MKLVTLRVGARSCVAEWGAKTLHVLDAPDMLSLIAADGRAARTGEKIDPKSATILAPVPRPPRNVFCIGKNYSDHVRELSRSGFGGKAAPGESMPDRPIVFTKVPESVIASGDAIRYPQGITHALDYEAELAVIIGRGGRGISRAEAMRHVFGYTALNDVTARDVQQSHKQWFLGKSFDTFCPMGPCLATADELDPANTELRCWVNGELRQSANTSSLIFDIPTLISTISAGITLLPGDVIATGTPAGVGMGFSPPRYLQVGDQVRIEIGGIGRLENVVAAGP
jgi:2-keto-4-pentenoate hydratase/2-oxohepta-3-ene-1,7-dioic acid hydratase in catechol pathway